MLYCKLSALSVKRFAKIILFSSCLAQPCTELLAQAAGSQSAPVDPLLREDWIQEERARAAGFASDLSSLLERTQERIRLTDKSGRSFTMSFTGNLFFNPLDGNWFPVIPDTAETPLHLAEADALAGRGLLNEALLIWKALVAMSLFMSDVPPYIRKQAAEATRRINALKHRSGFEVLERATDPYLFYNSIHGETVVLSDLYGWRLRLPGKFRFARSRSEDVSQIQSRSIVYLKQGNLVLLVGSDKWMRGWKYPTISEYMLLRDARRPLNAQRKDSLTFARKNISTEACFSGKSEQLKCGVFQSSLEARAMQKSGKSDKIEDVYRAANSGPGFAMRQFTFFEFYALRALAGFYLEMRYPEKQEQEARQVLEYAIQRVNFSQKE